MTSSLHGSHYHLPYRGLPPEVRHIIYTLATPAPTTINLRDHGRHLRGSRKRLLTTHQIRPQTLPILPLMRSSREAHDFYSRLLYSNNTFSFEANRTEVYTWLTAGISPTHLAQLRHVKLEKLTKAAKTLRELLQLLLHGMRLDSITLPVCTLHAGLEGVRKELCLAIMASTQRRPPSLRLEYATRQRLTRQWRMGLGGAVRMLEFSRYRGWDVEAWWCGRPVQGRKADGGVAPRVQDAMSGIIAEDQKMRPYTIGVVDDEMGLGVVVRWDVGAAKREVERLEKLFEEEGYDGGEEARAIEPFVIPMGKVQRVALAKEALERWEASSAL